MDAAWEARAAEVWARLDELTEDEFLAQIERLVASLPKDSGVAAFERAAALDSTGHSDRAVPLYREALAYGLDGERRRRAVIQLASSLRNLGRARESVALLTAERARTSDGLDDAVAAFLALALADVRAASAKGSRSPSRRSRPTSRATSARRPTTPARWSPTRRGDAAPWAA